MTDKLWRGRKYLISETDFVILLFVSKENEANFHVRKKLREKVSRIRENFYNFYVLALFLSYSLAQQFLFTNIFIQKTFCIRF